MDEPKNIDDSREFLRWFDKYSESYELATRVKDNLKKNKTKLDLKCVRLTNSDFKALAAMEPLKTLKLLNLSETGIQNEGLGYL